MDEAAQDRIRQAIIAWLGPMWDPDGIYNGSPDYRNATDVEELIAAILAAVRGDAQ